MKPTAHVIVSFTLGAALWFFTKNLYAGVLCFASGVLVDFDHFIEYIVHFGWKKITFKKIYYACDRRVFKRLYIIFHSIEIVILVWIAAICIKNIYLLAVALGYSSHLVMDSLGNPVRASFYFIFWRGVNNFDKKWFLKKNFGDKSRI